MLILSHYLPDLWKRLQLPCQPTIITEPIETKLHCTTVRANEIMEYAETQLFIYNLLLMKLIDDGDYKNVITESVKSLYRPKSSLNSST